MAACLALVAPVGMTEESRAEWLAVAWQTLKFLPSDLLSFGCLKARQTCDHPSKIVPTIIAETEQSMRQRREWELETVPEERRIEPNYVTPEEAAEILVEYGLRKPKQ